MPSNVNLLAMLATALTVFGIIALVTGGIVLGIIAIVLAVACGASARTIAIRAANRP